MCPRLCNITEKIKWMDWLVSSNAFLVTCGILLGLLLSSCLYGIKRLEEKIKDNREKVKSLAMERLTLVNKLDNLEREHVKTTKILKYGRLTDCELKKTQSLLCACKPGKNGQCLTTVNAYV